ncbi:hypothetical protein [Glaciecola sp. 1036]|uniref:hypothetical protein n=1 Tax=Alteromonadaceae TaxID=72275 RepID=UPI003D035DAF
MKFRYRLNSTSKLFLLAAFSIGCLFSPVSYALPISVLSGGNFEFNMQIEGGNQLPIGLESITDSILFNNSAAASLAAPDALDSDNQTDIIAGSGPDNPSIFSEEALSVRNLGTEGAYASNIWNGYGIRAQEVLPDGTNDFVERGIWGSSTSQIGLTTQEFNSQADSYLVNSRTLQLSNSSAFAITFDLLGSFSADVYAYANGDNGFAQSSVLLDMFFETQGNLDIVYTELEAYTPATSASSPLASSIASRTVDPAGSGHISFEALSIAEGDTVSGPNESTASGNFAFALAITLQPGQEMLMSSGVTFDNFVTFEANPSEVNAPSSIGFLLMTTFIGWTLRKNVVKS